MKIRFDQSEPYEVQESEALGLTIPPSLLGAGGSSHRMTSRSRFSAIDGVAITPDFTLKP